MEPMSVLIPRLWPFLCHTTSSVRRSTLQTLKTLTKSQQEYSTNTTIKSTQQQSTSPLVMDTTTITLTATTENGIDELTKKINSNSKNLVYNFGVKEWPSQLLQEALRHIYQRVLIEHIEDIQNLVEDVWYNLVTNAELSALLHAACPYVASWMCLAMQPSRLSFDLNLMIFSKPQQVNRVN